MAHCFFIFIGGHHARLRCFGLGVGTALAGLLAPIAWFLVRAYSDSRLSLVDELPPVAPALLPLVFCVMAFLPFRTALRTALICWLLVAGPILAYLLLHPAQLQTPRGQDMVILLGPAMLLVLAYFPFQRTLMLSNGSQLELAIFDVDHFKAVNDQHGHSVGDLVLREIATRCSARLGQGDLVARWGGEEFLLVHPVSSKIPIGHKAEELRRVIAQEPIGAVGLVNASFGVTRMLDGDTITRMLQRADEALYEAKRSGRNRVVAR